MQSFQAVLEGLSCTITATSHQMTLTNTEHLLLILARSVPGLAAPKAALPPVTSE